MSKCYGTNRYAGEIIINGYWDGRPIWREKTSAEKLIEYLNEEHDRKTRTLTIECDSEELCEDTK